MKIITLLICAAFVASCSPSAPVDLEREEYLVRALVLKIPGDEADPAMTRVRQIRKVEVAPKGDTAHVEGAYIQTPKSGGPALVEAAQQGRFVIEAKKGAGGAWEIVSDDITPPPPAPAKP